MSAKKIRTEIVTAQLHRSFNCHVAVPFLPCWSSASCGACCLSRIGAPWHACMMSTPYCAWFSSDTLWIAASDLSSSADRTETLPLEWFINKNVIMMFDKQRVDETIPVLAFSLSLIHI